MKLCNTSIVLAAAIASVGFCQMSQAGIYRTISLTDNSVSDWDGIAPSNSVPDAQGDGVANSSTGTVDFKNVYIANDDNYLYIRVELYAPANPTGYSTNLFLNTDGNAATGYTPGYGSDLLVQGPNGYGETGPGDFSGGTYYGNIATSQYVTSTGVDAEFAISRVNAFTSNDITLLAEADGDNYAAGDYAPLVSYSFAAVPEPTSLCVIGLGVLPLIRRRRRL